MGSSARAFDCDVSVAGGLSVFGGFALTGTMTSGAVPAARITSGTIAVARSWAYTGGDVTSSAGSAVLTIANGAVTTAKMASAPALTVLCRDSNSAGQTGYVAAAANTRGVLAENGAAQLEFITTVPILLGRITATTTVVNSNALTTIYTATVNHNDINGHALHVVIGGTYTNNSAANRTLQLRVLMGGSVYHRSVSLALTASATPRAWRLELQITSRTTTTQDAIGVFTMSSDTAAVVGDGSIGSLATLATPIHFAGVENTSGAGSKVVEVVVLHSAADPSLGISCTSGTITRL